MGIWIATVAVIVLTLLGLFLTGYMVYLLVGFSIGGIKHKLNLKKYPPITTRFGIISYEHPSWKFRLPYEDRELDVLLDDSDGQPDPKLLRYLQDHRDKLRRLAEAARRNIAEITSEFELEMLASSKDADVCLGFSRTLGDCGETIFVDMTGTEVVHWTIVD